MRLTGGRVLSLVVHAEARLGSMDQSGDAAGVTRIATAVAAGGLSAGQVVVVAG